MNIHIDILVRMYTFLSFLIHISLEHDLEELLSHRGFVCFNIIRDCLQHILAGLDSLLAHVTVRVSLSIFVTKSNASCLGSHWSYASFCE